MENKRIYPDISQEIRRATPENLCTHERFWSEVERLRNKIHQASLECKNREISLGDISRFFGVPIHTAELIKQTYESNKHSLPPRR